MQAAQPRLDAGHHVAEREARFGSRRERVAAGRATKPFQHAQEIDCGVDVGGTDRARGGNLALEALVDGTLAVTNDGEGTRNRADAVLPQELQAAEFGAETVARVAAVAPVELDDDARRLRRRTLVKVHPEYAAVAAGAERLRRHDIAPEHSTADGAEVSGRR